MVDLSADMAQLWSSLTPAGGGRARLIQFVGAAGGEGTSTVAREFARYAAQRGRRGVWLVDLDLLGSPAHRALAQDPGRYGALGTEAAGTPDGATFFTVQPPVRDANGRAWPDGRYLAAQSAGGSRLWVTRFRREALRPGQNVHILPTGDYWASLARYTDLVVVDAPAADRSSAALTVAPFMDETVIVVAADNKDVQAPAALRDRLTEAGGRCAGIVFNRAPKPAPGFIRALP